jgi:hypothetical protein
VEHKSKYSSIQIKTNIKSEIVNYCHDNGYKLSGLVEKLILNHLSGSLGVS